VADLHVDRTYQRSLESRRSQAAIEHICENFRWSLFDACSVTKGLTGYLIIDGQHRVEAARRRKISEVPCLVKSMASVQEQARAFVTLNRDRVAVTGFAIYHALVAAGDAEANEMARVCAAANVEVARYPMPVHHMPPTHTLSVASIRTAIARNGASATTSALTILRLCFDEPGALRAHLITALADSLSAGADHLAIEQALRPMAFKALERRIMDVAARQETSRVKAARIVIDQLGGLSAAQAIAAQPAIFPTVGPAEQPGESRQIPSKSHVPPPGSESCPEAAQADPGQRWPVGTEGRAEPSRTGSRDRQLCREERGDPVPAGSRGADRSAARVEVHARGSDACATARAGGRRERQSTAGEGRLT
jgi:hypothetical protein